MKINQSRNKREGRYMGKGTRKWGGAGVHYRKGAPLPDGLSSDMMGSLWAQCRSCEAVYEFQGAAHEFTQAMSYCGGNQWCTP